MELVFTGMWNLVTLIAMVKRKKIHYQVTDISKINFIKYSEIFSFADSRYNSSIVKEFERDRREHLTPASKKLSGAI
jgi:hypothetical protein